VALTLTLVPGQGHTIVHLSSSTTEYTQGGPKNAHPSHSDGLNNNKYVIKPWLYWYFKTIMNNTV